MPTAEEIVAGVRSERRGETTDEEGRVIQAGLGRPRIGGLARKSAADIINEARRKAGATPDVSPPPRPAARPVDIAATSLAYGPQAPPQIPRVIPSEQTPGLSADPALRASQIRALGPSVVTVGGVPRTSFASPEEAYNAAYGRPTFPQALSSAVEQAQTERFENLGRIAAAGGLRGFAARAATYPLAGITALSELGPRGMAESALGAYENPSLASVGGLAGEAALNVAPLPITRIAAAPLEAGARAIGLPALAAERGGFGGALNYLGGQVQERVPGVNRLLAARLAVREGLAGGERRLSAEETAAMTGVQARPMSIRDRLAAREYGIGGDVAGEPPPTLSPLRQPEQAAMNLTEPTAMDLARRQVAGGEDVLAREIQQAKTPEELVSKLAANRERIAREIAAEEDAKRQLAEMESQYAAPAKEEAAPVAAAPKPQIPPEEAQHLRPGEEKFAPEVRRALVEARQRAAAAETSPITGLPKKEVYDRTPKKEVQAAADLDGLKWTNDNLGHEAGNSLLKAYGDALREEGVEAYHIGGDEFAAQGDNAPELQAKLDRVAERFKNATFEIKDTSGKTYRVAADWGVTHATGPDYATADRLATAAKEQRTLQGRRPARGEPIPGVRGFIEGTGGETRPVESAGNPPVQPATGGEPAQVAAPPAADQAELQRPREILSRAELGRGRKTAGIERAFQNTLREIAKRTEAGTAPLPGKLPYSGMGYDEMVRTLKQDLAASPNKEARYTAIDRFRQKTGLPMFRHGGGDFNVFEAAKTYEDPSESVQDMDTLQERMRKAGGAFGQVNEAKLQKDQEAFYRDKMVREYGDTIAALKSESPEDLAALEQKTPLLKKAAAGGKLSKSELSRVLDEGTDLDLAKQRLDAVRKARQPAELVAEPPPKPETVAEEPHAFGEEPLKGSAAEKVSQVAAEDFKPKSLTALADRSDITAAQESAYFRTKAIFGEKAADDFLSQTEGLTAASMNPKAGWPPPNLENEVSLLNRQMDRLSAAAKKEPTDLALTGTEYIHSGSAAATQKAESLNLKLDTEGPAGPLFSKGEEGAIKMSTLLSPFVAPDLLAKFILKKAFQAPVKLGELALSPVFGKKSPITGAAGPLMRLRSPEIVTPELYSKIEDGMVVGMKPAIMAAKAELKAWEDRLSPLLRLIGVGTKLDKAVFSVLNGTGTVADRDLIQSSDAGDVVKELRAMYDDFANRLGLTPGLSRVEFYVTNVIERDPTKLEAVFRGRYLAANTKEGEAVPRATRRIADRYARTMTREMLNILNGPGFNKTVDIQALLNHRGVDFQGRSLWTKNTMPAEIFDPYLLHRMGTDLPVRESAVQAANAYIYASVKKLHFDPLLRRVEPMLKEASISDEVVGNYIESQINDFLGRARPLDKAVDRVIYNLRAQFYPRIAGAVAGAMGGALKGAAYGSLLTPLPGVGLGAMKIGAAAGAAGGAIRGAVMGTRAFAPFAATRFASNLTGGFYRGALGLALDSAALNMTQSVNTITDAGLKNFLVGVGRMAKDYRAYTPLTGQSANVARMQHLGVLDEFRGLWAGDKPLTDETKSKIERLIMSPFNFAELVNRGIAFHAYSYAAEKAGLSKAQSLRVGEATASSMVPTLSVSPVEWKAMQGVRKTQFAYGPADTPGALQGPVAQLTAQFTSFPRRQFEFMVDGFHQAVKENDNAKLLRYYALAGFFTLAGTATFGELTGIDLSGLSWRGLAPSGVGPVPRAAAQAVGVAAGTEEPEKFAKTLRTARVPASRAIENMARSWEILRRGGQLPEEEVARSEATWKALGAEGQADLSQEEIDALSQTDEPTRDTVARIFGLSRGTARRRETLRHTLEIMAARRNFRGEERKQAYGTPLTRLLTE